MVISTNIPFPRLYRASCYTPRPVGTFYITRPPTTITTPTPTPTHCWHVYNIGIDGIKCYCGAAALARLLTNYLRRPSRRSDPRGAAIRVRRWP